MDTDKLAEAEAHFNEYNRQEQNGHTLGTELGKTISDTIGDHPHALAATLANILLELDDERKCPTLIHQWMMDHYWGAHVAKHAPIFDECFYKLMAMGAISRQKALRYGDLDYSIWAEEYTEFVDLPRLHKGDTDNKFEKKVRIIYSDSHTSCADDNVHVWIRDWYKFHCRRTRWEDDKLIPYDTKYGDGRDRGYSFSINLTEHRKDDEKVDWALLNYHNIERALEYLRMVKDAVTDPNPSDLPTIP